MQSKKEHLQQNGHTSQDQVLSKPTRHSKNKDTSPTNLSTIFVILL